MKKFKLHLMHVLGGFFIGLSLMEIFVIKQQDSLPRAGLHFLLFVTLTLLGVGYLAEKAKIP